MKKKSAEKRRHVVAWANKAEWDQVLEYLYSADCALQRFALRRVSAWRGRYANSAPVAVDCTADLVRCQVLDRSGQLDAEDLVLLYGAGLVRFVNLITERQQGRTARPLRRLAGNLDIPEWVVNLRHDVTHRKLPTLPWCRKGCKVVLEWLQQKYWSRQLGGGPHEDWDSESDGEEEEEEEEEGLRRQKEVEAYSTARELLVAFEKERFQALDGPPEARAPSRLLAELKLLALQAGELLVAVLLEDGFLVPTAEQLAALGCGGGGGGTADPRAAAEPRLAPAFLRFWLPLLKSLFSAAFIHLLLEKLFVELTPRPGEPGAQGSRAFYVAAWISEIIVCNSNTFEFHFETKGQRKARVKDRLFVNRIQLRWQQLLAACLEAPCASTPRLLRLILDDMEHPLPLDTRHKLLQLSAIYTQGAHRQESDPRPRQRPIYTLESLHDELRHARRRHPRRAEAQRGDASPDGQAEKARGLRGSAWQLCADDVSWKNYPLGKVPGQSDDPSRLMAERYSTMTVVDQPVELEAPLHVPGGSAPPRPADGLLWNHSDVTQMKSGLTLF